MFNIAHPSFHAFIRDIYLLLIGSYKENTDDKNAPFLDLIATNAVFAIVKAIFNLSVFYFALVNPNKRI